ncbi:MAG TPA: Trp family transcriptional regulator [Patescibacteria group bacterium]|nr:Trp family transcriptional regulator [Patescibacteria group bacterium]
MQDFDSFIELIHSIKDKSLLEDFFLGITTTRERAEIMQRVEIIKRLLQGEPQIKIAKELGVGVATVTRGSKELAQGRFKALREQLL